MSSLSAGALVAGMRSNQLVASLAAMAHGENYYFFAVEVIQRNVSSVSEFDDPLAKLWRQLVEWTAHLRMLAQRLHSLADGFDGALGCVATLGSQEIVQA